MSIRQLVFDFFALCGHRPIEVCPGVWQVKADDGLMQALDGWRAQGRLLQFSFQRDLAEAYGAELISPGSYRLNTILRLVQGQGLLSQAHIPHHLFHEPGIRKRVLAECAGTGRAYVLTSSAHFGQYLQLELSAQARGLQKKESLHTIVVNLSSGEVLKFAFPFHLLQAGSVPTEQIRRRKCSLKQAYLKAAAHVSELWSQDDQSWVEQALGKMAEEEKKLREFYQGRTSTAEFTAKLQELRGRLHPGLSIRALRGAILFTPLFSYRLVVVSASGRERVCTVMYDPIANLRELD